MHLTSWVSRLVQADCLFRICQLAWGSGIACPSPWEGLASLRLALATDFPILPPGGDYLRLGHGEQESKRVPLHRCTGGRRQEVGPSGDISGFAGGGVEKRREGCITTSLAWAPCTPSLPGRENKPFEWGGVRAATEALHGGVTRAV